MEPTHKTWGPFNGRQLTTMVCVIAAAVLFPAGAWAAVSFSNVAITDPGGVNRAKVDATGRLDVGDGAGPLTVDGAVSTRPVLPTKPITIVTHDISAGPTTIYGPRTTAFGISSLTEANDCGVVMTVTLDSVVSTGGTFAIQTVLIPPMQTLHFTYPTMLVVTPPAGGTASLRAVATANCVELSGVGVQT